MDIINLKNRSHKMKKNDIYLKITLRILAGIFIISGLISAAALNEFILLLSAFALLLIGFIIILTEKLNKEVHKR
jgi:hypothetical protein